MTVFVRILCQLFFMFVKLCKDRCSIDRHLSMSSTQTCARDLLGLSMRYENMLIVEGLVVTSK